LWWWGHSRSVWKGMHVIVTYIAFSGAKVRVEPRQLHFGILKIIDFQTPAHIQ
jgi:hypothetical protein